MHILDFARSNKLVVHQRYSFGVYLQDIIQTVTTTFAVEIEIRMVCRTPQSGFIRSRGVLYEQLAFFERVLYGQCEFAGISFFPVLAYILERYRVLCLFDYLKGLFVETAFAAVKMVVPDVLCYVVFLSVERDSVSRYTVAYSAYSRAAVCFALLVIGLRVKPQRNIHAVYDYGVYPRAYFNQFYCYGFVFESYHNLSL